MKWLCLFLFSFLFYSCSNKTIDDLETSILDDESIDLFSFQNPARGGGSVSIGFTSILNELPPETRANIDGYAVYIDRERKETLPLSATRVSRNGTSGRRFCFALAFSSALGDSRITNNYCLIVP